MTEGGSRMPRLCYCTNVHPGGSWEEMCGQLATHAAGVREELGRDELGIGLWMPAGLAREVVARNRIRELGDFLAGHGLRALTMNGFPFGNFHGPVVKTAVYQPDWTSPGRLGYTRDLAVILAGLSNEGEDASISTLPIGWPELVAPDGETMQAAADNLAGLAGELAALEQATGVRVHVDLEPEPGCILQRSADVVAFWSRLGGDRDAAVRRHLGVCHDICHAAVMFEAQAEALATYRAAGIPVGKIQVSSAVRVIPVLAWSVDALAGFNESRYLHQTVLLRQDGTLEQHADLPVALDAMRAAARLYREARTHFHVPLFLDEIGALETTAHEIGECLAALGDGELPTLEIETYAWGVLPEGVFEGSLAEGIAEEIRFLESLLSRGRTV